MLNYIWVQIKNVHIFHVLCFVNITYFYILLTYLLYVFQGNISAYNDRSIIVNSFYVFNIRTLLVLVINIVIVIQIIKLSNKVTIQLYIIKSFIRSLLISSVVLISDGTFWFLSYSQF